MDLQDWNAVIAVIIGVLTIIGMGNRKFERLEARIAAQFDEVNRRIDKHATNDRVDTVDTKIDRLEAKIDRLDSTLNTKIDKFADDLRVEMRAGFTEANHRLSVLEQRTYDLAHPPPAVNG